MAGSSVLNIMHPVISEWFEKNIGEPSAPQVEGWPAIQRGENVLIVAPTGAGKTLSAFLECINHLFVQCLSGETAYGVQVLYVSPLKALNNDIYRNLEVPLKGIEELCEERGVSYPHITMGLRTGDTPANERRSMIKNPPHILITTPESLYLILTSSGSRDILKSVKYMIVDEIHTLLGSKRGVHLAVSMERLAALTGREMTRIGLSATVKPVEEAARYLGGFREVEGKWVPRPVNIIQPPMGKSTDLKIHIPVKDYRVIEEKTIWPAIYREILQLVREHTSTLIFVNSRAVAEKVSANINDLAGKPISKAHHGCISKESRLEVEKQLKSGELPCLVATSSMELGIDVGAIDLVIQVASPKSVSRGLQRLGRAGHKLNAVSKGRVIPRTRSDLLESAIVAREMLNGSIEEEYVPKNSLDVLSQQLVAMSCTGEWTIDEIERLLKSTYSYQTLKRDELERVLGMLAGDYERHFDIPRSPRIIWDRINGIMRGNSYSRMLAVGGSGTIPDRGYYGVYLEDGKTRLGELDETFVYEARIGERFMLGTSAWRIEEIRRDRVVVSPSGSMGAKTPFWTGEGLGRPYQLGLLFGSFLDELSDRAGREGCIEWLTSNTPMDGTAAMNLEKYIIDQKAALGCLAGSKRIVVEHFSDEVGDTRIVLHSPLGGRVNGGLKILLQHALGDTLHCQVEASHSDDGVLVNILGYHEHPKNILSLLSEERVQEILIDDLPTTPLFTMTFRYNAARALMMGQKRYGVRTQLWAQRIKAMEVMQAAEKYTDHPLIVETFRECMEMILDIPNLIKVISGIKSGEIEVVERVTSHPSPFTQELLFNFMGVMMYEGQIPDFKKLGNRIISEPGALNLDYKSVKVDNESVREALSKTVPINAGRQLKSADDFHNYLLTYGDLTLTEESIGKLCKICTEDVRLWMESLDSIGRITFIDPGEGYARVCIAFEEYAMYAAAFGTGHDTGLNNSEWTREEALSRIIRRYARYNSPFGMEDIYKRYTIEKEMTDKILKRLEQDGYLVKGGIEGNNGGWCHTAVFERARKISLYNARSSVKSKEPSSFASFLPQWQHIAKTSISPVEDLYEAVKQLQGFYLPPDWWEDFVFPARVTRYRKTYLDKLCSTGRIIWRIKAEGSSPKLAWYTADVTGPSLDDENLILSEKEKYIYDILKKKGASFFHVISAVSAMDGGELIDILESMVWKGVVINDSFEPVRYFLSSKPAGVRMKARMRTAVYKIEMGRWGIADYAADTNIEERLMTYFNRYGLVSKEILNCEKSEIPWSDAYEILKQWEYTGKVNRGYYIKGISGMQFSLPGVPERLNEESGYAVLDACDPAQVYGRIIPFQNENVFWMCIPGNAVVLKSGVPVLIVECYGERFQSITDSRETLLEAVKSFIETFNNSGIWPNQKRIKIKQWDGSTASKCELSEELGVLGFNREMQDLVMWK